MCTSGATKNGLFFDVLQRYHFFGNIKGIKIRNDGISCDMSQSQSSSVCTTSFLALHLQNQFGSVELLCITKSEKDKGKKRISGVGGPKI